MFYMFGKFNPASKTEKHTIKEWEINTGIKIIIPKGFREPKNKIATNLYTRRAFKRCAKNNVITCKTNKGLEFLNSLGN